MQQVIVDKNAPWFINTARFTFVDPVTKVAFEPGVPVQVKVSPWMKGQPVIKEWDDAKGEVKTAAPATAPAPSPAPAPAPAASTPAATK